MAGGGAVMACDSTANEYNRYIRCAVAMNPFGDINGTSITVPIMFISSENDATVNPFMPGVSSSPSSVYSSFNSVPASTVKAFANFNDMDHNGVVNKDIFLATSGNASVFLPIMLSWFKVYLNGDTDYAKYLDENSLEFSRFENRFTSKGNIPAYVYNN
jgi:hypothetical protein